MNRLSYAVPVTDPQMQAEWIASSDRYGQFYDSYLNRELGQDFENWLAKTAASLGLAWQPGPDARTSAANFYSAFEVKLAEAAALEASPAPEAQPVLEAQPVVEVPSAPPAMSEPLPETVISAVIVDATGTPVTITSASPTSSLPAISPASRIPQPAASYYGGGGAAYYAPASLGPSQLTQDALTEKPVFNWGAILTLAAILFTASRGG